MTDIKIVDEYFVRCKKEFWHSSEIILAQCFNFDINIDTNIIVADLRSTSKRSLFEFIKLSFKHFSESPLSEGERNDFYAEVQQIYQRIHDEVEPVVAAALPYYDRMYKHQKDGIIDTYYKKHNLFAYEQRLGKTLMAASISKVHKIGCTLIVCPNNVKYTWYRQLTDTFGFNQLYFTILDASKKRTIRAFSERFVVINYDILGKYMEELLTRDIGHIIIDECHRAKNKGTSIFKNLSKIAEHFPEARISLLSGTPVKNRVDDVFAYLKLTGHKLGNNYKKFMEEYTIRSVGRFSKVKGGRNLQDLYVKLSNFMIRKTQAECLDLPEKIYMSYRYELDDYRTDYDKVIEELSMQQEQSSLSGSIHSLNIITSRSKMKGVQEIAEGIIEEGKKVVIFTGYKVPIGILEEYFGGRCAKIVGGMSAFDRDKSVERFWKDETCQVLLANTKAGGEGIDLSVASDIIMCDFPLTPSELAQATNRCTNPGKREAVAIHYTIANDSIDEILYELLSDKSRDINALIDQGRGEAIGEENITTLLINKLLKRDGGNSDNTTGGVAAVVDISDSKGSGVVAPQEEEAAVAIRIVKREVRAPYIQRTDNTAQIERQDVDVPDFLMD